MLHRPGIGAYSIVPTGWELHFWPESRPIGGGTGAWSETERDDMNQYEIFDNGRLKSIFADLPVILANKPIDAIRAYLASVGEGDKQVKVSASRHVRICAKPVPFKWGKRQVWVEVR